MERDDTKQARANKERDAESDEIGPTPPRSPREEVAGNDFEIWPSLFFGLGTRRGVGRGRVQSARANGHQSLPSISEASSGSFSTARNRTLSARGLSATSAAEAWRAP